MKRNRKSPSLDALQRRNRPVNTIRVSVHQVTVTCTVEYRDVNLLCNLVERVCFENLGCLNSVGLQHISIDISPVIHREAVNDSVQAPLDLFSQR